MMVPAEEVVWKKHSAYAKPEPDQAPVEMYRKYIDQLLGMLEDELSAKNDIQFARIASVDKFGDAISKMVDIVAEHLIPKQQSSLLMTGEMAVEIRNRFSPKFGWPEGFVDAHVTDDGGLSLMIGWGDVEFGPDGSFVGAGTDVTRLPMATRIKEALSIFEKPSSFEPDAEEDDPIDYDFVPFDRIFNKVENDPEQELISRIVNALCLFHPDYRTVNEGVQAVYPMIIPLLDNHPEILSVNSNAVWDFLSKVIDPRSEIYSTEGRTFVKQVFTRVFERYEDEHPNKTYEDEHNDQEIVEPEGKEDPEA